MFGCSLLDEAATGSKSEDSRTSGESPHRSNIVCIYIRWFMYQQCLEMYMHECIMKISKNLSLLNAHVWYMIHNLAI